MPVNRAARDRLASVLAGYLRGDVDNFALDKVATAADLPEDDPAVADIGSTLWFLYDDLRSHPVSMSPDGWQLCRRILAFLKSELERKPACATGRSRWQRTAGLASAFAIVVSAALAWRLSPWCLLLPGFVVGVPVAISSYVRNDQPSEEQRYWPFEDAEQWRRHEHLLDAERLPAYDPARHARPIRGPVLSAFMLIPATVVFVLIVAPLLAVLMVLPQGRRGPAVGFK